MAVPSLCEELDALDDEKIEVFLNVGLFIEIIRSNAIRSLLYAKTDVIDIIIVLKLQNESTPPGKRVRDRAVVV